MTMTESTEVKSSDAGNLQLETWPIGRLVPSPRNARKHSKAQIAEIAGSITAFGFANPILADPDGEVIAGHGRLVAAKQLGKSMVPVIVISGLTDRQKRELMLADNRIALNARWQPRDAGPEAPGFRAVGRPDLAGAWLFGGGAEPGPRTEVAQRFHGRRRCPW